MTPLERYALVDDLWANVLAAAASPSSFVSFVERFGGEVPTKMSDLVTLPGVGRKTANVVRSVAMDLPGLPVDTHVQRISQRLGWTKHGEPQEIEQDLMALFPRSDWDMLSHTLIFHGRRVCAARKPACAGASMATPRAFT